MMRVTPHHPSSRALVGALRFVLLALGIVLALGWSALAAGPAMPRPPAELNVTANTAEVSFPAEVRFRLIASDPASTIERVQLFFSVDDSPVLQEATPEFRPGRTVEAEFQWAIRQLVVPGSEISYYWRVQTASGNHWTTDPQRINYDDTRFDWRQARDGFIVVYSYGSGEAASQGLLKDARNVLDLMEREYGLILKKEVKVFVYADQQEYLSAFGPLQVSSRAVTVGTDRIFMLLSELPEENAQAIRHEVLHTVFLQRTENAFNRAPRWLTEGFSMFLSGEEISPENIGFLRQLDSEGQLFSLRSLNAGFPSTDRERTIAYLESYSVLRYIIEEFGTEKLKALLAAIGEGNATDNAFVQALGVTVGELDQRWRESLRRGEQSGATTAPRVGQVTDDAEEGWFARTMGFWDQYLGFLGRPILIGLVVAALIVTILGFRSGRGRRRKSSESDD